MTDRDDNQTDPIEDKKPDVVEATGSLSESLRAFVSEGLSSVKAVNEARRAHLEAREDLERLGRTIEERERELSHRRDIEGRYESILTERQAILAEADRTRDEAMREQERLRAEKSAFEEELGRIQKEDASTERRLKELRAEAEGREKSARESLRRLQKKFDEANDELARAVESHQMSVEAARDRIDDMRSQLQKLNDEYAELQRNPSANSAEYSVRSRELEIEISDAADALRIAQAELPAIDMAAKGDVESARAAVRTAEAPLPAARSALDAAEEAASRARSAYEAARNEAKGRAAKMDHRADELQRQMKEQVQAIGEAERKRDGARADIDEATDIHEHPEATEAIARALAADRAEIGEREREVERLASIEKDVRARTRGSRTRFLLSIAGIALALVLFIVWTQLAK